MKKQLTTLTLLTLSLLLVACNDKGKTSETVGETTTETVSETKDEKKKAELKEKLAKLKSKTDKDIEKEARKKLEEKGIKNPTKEQLQKEVAKEKEEIKKDIESTEKDIVAEEKTTTTSTANTTSKSKNASANTQKSLNNKSSNTKTTTQTNNTTKTSSSNTSNNQSQDNTKISYETKTIPYITSRKYNIPGAKTRIAQSGKNGYEKIKITSKNGQVVSRETVETVSPREEIIETYIKLQSAKYEEREVEDKDKPIYTGSSKKRWFIKFSDGSIEYFYSAVDAEETFDKYVNDYATGKFKKDATNWGTAEPEFDENGGELLGYEKKTEKVKVQDEKWDWR